MQDSLDPYFKPMLKGLVDGRVVPFLGAGVNLCGRAQGQAWQQGQTELLPSGRELARFLAENFGYPVSEKEASDLARVSQYVAVTTGTGPLYDELHSLFDGDYPPNMLHRFLAELPKLLQRKNYPARYQLIVTTNYDDVLERAFNEAGEPFDLVAYMADGELRGRFLHWSPDRDEAIPIEKPNEYTNLSLDERTIILKIHGMVDRKTAEQDSYVITEDHYIDYLARTDIANLIPITLAAKLRKSHFLFLGYSLSDWNLRVILHRIWGEQKLSYKSWAIQLNPNTLEEEFWNKRGVDILNRPLDDYVAQLNDHVKKLPVAKKQA